MNAGGRTLLTLGSAVRARLRNRAAAPVGAGNSAVVVDLPRWGPMLSSRVPNLVPIPGPGWSAKPLVSAHDRIMGTHTVLG